MATITKKHLIDRISQRTDNKRTVVKKVVQDFLDEIIEELAHGNRLEFRDFGVFESRVRASRIAQNPKTLERVYVPAKRTVKFKVGRLMKKRLMDSSVVAQADMAAKSAAAASPDALGPSDSAPAAPPM
jgi:integration host factor subunit beta